MNTTPKAHSIGIVIGAFKPYTAGHHFLVEQAAKENDDVMVFVSQNDRKRKGELPVTNESMKRIWNRYIKPGLPKNVNVFDVENPVIALFNLLDFADEHYVSGETPKAKIYMDEKDKIRYCYEEHQIEKKFPKYYKDIEIKSFVRSANIDVSGTRTRKAIQNNNFEEFVECLPTFLHEHAKEIFVLLA